MEDGRRDGRGRMVSGPVVNVDGPPLQSAWQTAIADGSFEDDDAEAVKGLGILGNGRLHATRDQDHGNRGSQHLAAGHHYTKRPSPYPLGHDLQQPVPGFNFGPLSSQAPAAARLQPQIAKGKQTDQKEPATNVASKKRQGQQQDVVAHVDKKRRATSVASSGQSIPSPRQPITTSYRLPSRPPPGLLSPTPNKIVDISKRLPGVEILHKCMAQLLAPSPEPATGALVTWCRPPQAEEPMFLVLVGMDIRHQYPITFWKSQWSGGPETVFITLKEGSGAEVTVGLMFPAQPAADAFLQFSRKLIEKAKSQPKATSQSLEPVASNAPATSASLPQIQITPPSSGTSEATQPSQGSQNLQPQKKLIANIVGTAQTSQPASNIIRNGQVAAVNQMAKPKAEGSEVKVPVEEAFCLISVDSVPATTTPKACEKKASYTNELFGLSIWDEDTMKTGQQPGKDCFPASLNPQAAVASPTAAENASEVFSRCKTIISQTSDILRLDPMAGISVDEDMRRRLLGEIAEKFSGINKGQKGYVVSMLLRLFDTVMRPDGLRYSAEELVKLRADAALPSGWVCLNVRADLSSCVSDGDDEEPVQGIADLRKQLDRVAGKQAELAKAQAQAELQAVATAQPSTQDELAPAKRPENSRWAAIAPKGGALNDLVALVPRINPASPETQVNNIQTPAVLPPQGLAVDSMDALDMVFRGLSLAAVPSARNTVAETPGNVFNNSNGNAPTNNSGTYLLQGASMI
ncbi:hypothetical protein RB593_002876 [Gaeumannomyces tritici]